MGHITERADSFAKKLAKKEPVDNRSDDEKMAEFNKKYKTMDAVQGARRRVKHARPK